MWVCLRGIRVHRVYFTQIFYLVILATIFSLIIYPVFVYYLLYNILLYCNFEAMLIAFILLNRITFAPARKPCWIGLLFTRKNADFRRRYMKGLPFLSKMLYRRVRGWTTRRSLPFKTLLSNSPQLLAFYWLFHPG